MITKSFGKTRVATNLIGKFLDKSPAFKVIVVVPTTTLKEQWENILKTLGYNCEVYVINTAVKENRNCDLLVVDEFHRAASNTASQIFTKIKYKYILGLTATLTRLDGKEALLKKYCPVVDSIPLEVALFNHWVSDFKEYKIVIDVPDIGDYMALDAAFNEHFGYFGYDFNLIMNKLIGPKGFVGRCKYRDLLCPANGKNDEQRKALLTDITFHATSFQKAMAARKNFIYNHPKKLELVHKIIEARPNTKIVTFAANVKMAESVKYGKVYSSRESKKKSRITINELKHGDINIINTVKRGDEGLDVDGISVAIQFGIDSSPTRAIQRVGRAIRFAPGKQAEIFTIVINDTQELKWYDKSHENMSYITIDEEGLNDVLQGKEPKPYVKPLKRFMFRY